MLKPKDHNLKNLEYLERLDFPESLKEEIKGHAVEECMGDCKLAVRKLVKTALLEWE